MATALTPRSSAAQRRQRIIADYTHLLFLTILEPILDIEEGSMAVIRIVVGLLSLFLGRQLFWLFVAAAGFFLGVNVAGSLFEGAAPWLVLLVGLAFGLVGALLAVLLQGLAVAAAGFVVGGVALVALLQALGVAVEGRAPILTIVGGIIGALLVLALFDVALIVLSSLTGATLIVQAVSLDPPLPVILFFLLLIIGIAVQYSLMRRYPETTRRIRRVRRRGESRPA
jgi:hypothetical protein